MRYLGGKTRLAKHIAEAILTDTDSRSTYIEPMVGGGSVLAEMAPHFNTVFAGDIHPDLVMLYVAVKNGWIPPHEVSEFEYQNLKRAVPSALRGFVGFGCSFGGRWFEGYARNATKTNYAAQSSRSLVKISPNIRSVHFYCQPYQDWFPKPADVVYLDPPYRGTKPYSGTAPFDHDEFWNIARRWRSLGAHVYVSEFAAPEDWTPIWEKPRKVGLGVQSNASYRTETDKLFK